MRKAGYYWVQFHDYGAVRAVRWKNRAWHYDHDVTDADLKVMDGPLLPPSVEDLARQPEHLARVVAADWEHVGCDPRRDGHHVDGTYWVSFRGKKPVLAELFEDYWMSVDRTDGEFAWDGPLTEIQPTILFGPLDRPLGRHRITPFVQGLIDNINAQQAARAEMEEALVEMQSGRQEVH